MPAPTLLQKTVAQISHRMHRTFPDVKSTHLLWNAGTKADQGRLLSTLPKNTLDIDKPEDAELLRKIIEFDSGNNERFQRARSSLISTANSQLLCALLQDALDRGASSLRLRSSMCDDFVASMFGSPPPAELEQQVADVRQKVEEDPGHYLKPGPSLELIIVLDGIPESLSHLPANLKDPLWQEVEFATTCRPERYFDRGDIKIPLTQFKPQITPDLISIPIVLNP